MAAQSAIILCTAASGAQQTAPMTFTGGRAVLAITATTYDATCYLQTQIGVAWVNVNATAYTANQLTAGLDLPSGTYRMNLGAATSNLTATLVRLVY